MAMSQMHILNNKVKDTNREKCVRQEMRAIIGSVRTLFSFAAVVCPNFKCRHKMC